MCATFPARGQVPQGFGGETLRKDGSIISKLILKTWNGRHGIE